MAAIAVAAGQYLSSSVSPMLLNGIAMAAAFFVCGFGNIMNDIVDIESDRINHPRRALPSGKLSPGSAKVLAALFLIISIVLALELTLTGIMIVFAALILLTLYNLRLKHTSYWGNIAVSLLGGLAFVIGAEAGGIQTIRAIPGVLIAAGFAFAMHLGREIIKDIQDCSGDVAMGSRTAPVLSGTVRPLLFTYGIFAAIMGFGYYVYAAGWYDRSFLYISVLCIHIPVIIQFVWLGLNPNKKKCEIVSSLIKIEMIPGILALLIGKSY